MSKFDIDAIKVVNREQYQALDLMLNTDYNIFLSGRAGCGKSWILNQFIKEAEGAGLNVIVTAPTGRAAINIKGATLSRVFRIPLGVVLPTYSCNNIVMHADVVIIDEISMCRIDTFEYVMTVIQMCNIERRKKSLKNIKIIVCGDFFQLPPVITSTDGPALFSEYAYCKDGFAFESPLWNECNFVPIILKNVIRQSDALLCKALNMIRVGNTKAIPYFNQMCAKQPINDAIYICGRNSDVERINSEKYNSVQEQEQVYSADIFGDIQESEYPNDKQLAVKVGTRVMIIANGNKYSTGSLGTVKALYKNSVDVLLDNGKIVVNLEKFEWEVYRYDVDSKTKKLEKKVIGSYCQIPLKLGYAITIHKSQGATYEAANIMPRAWDKGQLYVALSRVKSIENMYLTEIIRPRYLVSARSVYNFYSALVSERN